MILAAAMMGALHLLPRPDVVAPAPCAHPFTFSHALRVDRAFDDGALDEIVERWKALGIPPPRRADTADVRVVHAQLPQQAYRLRVTEHGDAIIEAGGAQGAFYAAMTLAQLPVRTPGGWQLPCVTISDAPALKWRVLSDDVSRGPLPTMRYFKERIRTIAAFKMNGYSPYMEHVFVDPHDPLPAPLDGITPAQLRELQRYSARYHVAFIPEQQTFAHMHNTLRVEQYAEAAEEPHSFLLSPASPLSLQYIRRVITDELAAVTHPRFFHIGSDETSALGDERSKALVAQRGRAQVYAEHIRLMNDIIKPSGARIMLWDDGIENDPGIMKLIPKDAVIINWHYGKEPSFMRYITLVASGGFDQMVAPGDSNWNQIYPDITTALENVRTFVTEGKEARVFGLFQTVWHDDGESLFEATWYPVLYAAASAWERQSVDPARFQADFPYAFFGSDDSGYGDDIAKLAAIQAGIANAYEYSSNYLMWADPFDPLAAAHMEHIDIRPVRRDAEAIEQHLLARAPPLHANAARVMFLAARKYDFIGRKFQAAQEIRRYYGPSSRGLSWAKYWFWELRDGYEELEPLYAAAWRYEDRESHLAANLERYHLAAQRNIQRADRVYDASLQYSATKKLPPLDEIIR
jgi:hexosaminidase